jgi:hypothetical protein
MHNIPRDIFLQHKKNKLREHEKEKSTGKRERQINTQTGFKENIICIFVPLNRFYVM